MHTLSAVIKHGGFLYSSDSYNDDLPYWVRVDGTPHLIIPYTLEVNDMKFGVAPATPRATAGCRRCRTASTCSTPRVRAARR